MEKRTCRSCTACCKTHPVREISKPGGVWCKHCDRGTGCRIYEQRPRGCADFACAWLLGLGEDEDKPSRTKIVVDCFSHPVLGSSILFFEAKPGILEKPEVMRKLHEKYILRGEIVLLIPLKGDCTLYIPEELAHKTFTLPGRKMVVRTTKRIR